jgi:hypothetical protein
LHHEAITLQLEAQRKTRLTQLVLNTQFRLEQVLYAESKQPTAAAKALLSFEAVAREKWDTPMKARGKPEYCITDTGVWIRRRAERLTV